jgi:hypothetical protein
MPEAMLEVQASIRTTERPATALESLLGAKAAKEATVAAANRTTTRAQLAAAAVAAAQVLRRRAMAATAATTPATNSTGLTARKVAVAPEVKVGV